MSLAVENSLEDWMGLYNSVMKVSLLPHPPLERELPQLRLRCDARDDYLLLLPRRIKMVRATCCFVAVSAPELSGQVDTFDASGRFFSSCLRCACSSNCFMRAARWGPGAAPACATPTLP
jgi:hypothetical protein